MKPRVGRGRGAAGLTRYLLDEGPKSTGLKKPEIVGGTLSGTTSRTLTRELSAIRELRPDIKKHLWHCSLALPAGERLSSEKWAEVVKDFMQVMEFTDEHAYVVIRHNDTEHDHVHIAASRIGLDRSVWHGKWEVPKAIEAAQFLEKRHGLTITKGLYDDEGLRDEADRSVKSLTPAEINRAVRTGEEPPRQKLQALVSAAAKGQPSVVQFAERLELAGVGVRANVASTGTLSGFSFEIDGIAFKGSDLGKNFTWKGLQAQGVTYEQTRDRQGLSRFKPAAVADGRVDPAATAADQPDAARPIDAAVISSDRDSERAGEPVDAESGRGQGARSLRQSDSAPAGVAGLSVNGDDRASSGELRVEDESTERDAERPEQRSGSIDDDNQQDRQLAVAAIDSNGQPGDSERAPGESSDQRAAATMEAPSGVVSSDDAGGSSGISSVSGWASRFKQASAAKRRSKGAEQLPITLEQSDKGRAPVDAGDRRAAREVDPTHYLESQGFEVVRDGGDRHLSVRQGGDEIYRVTKKHDGHWLWCDFYGNAGGDNIDLVKEIENIDGFADAVYRFISAPINPIQVQPVLRKPPTMPLAFGSEALGREYLRGRGISQIVIEHAEQCGMLRYAPESVFFVGTDEAGKVQSATRRAIDPTDDVQRRDLKGSDKRFPAILDGDPGNVWIVEGGVDALALHTVCARRGDPAPLVIVSGGSNVCGFLESPHIQEILRSADRVTIAGETEKDEKTQAKTDAARGKQAERIVEITDADVRLWTPKPESGKDLGEYNLTHAAHYERQRAEVKIAPKVDDMDFGLS